MDPKHNKSDDDTGKMEKTTNPSPQIDINSLPHQPLELPEDKEVSHRIRQTMELTRVSGPLHHPYFLEKYEKIMPGLATRIISMAETQEKHRISMEKAVVTNSIERSKHGQYGGFACATFCLVIALYCVHTGNPGWAATIVGSVISGLAGVFIFGTLQQRNELSAKKAEHENRSSSKLETPSSPPPA